ncbi:MAG: hypothetical protein Q9188_004014 [Gyalolechia gomerana]
MPSRLGSRRTQLNAKYTSRLKEELCAAPSKVSDDPSAFDDRVAARGNEPGRQVGDAYRARLESKVIFFINIARLEPTKDNAFPYGVDDPTYAHYLCREGYEICLSRQEVLHRRTLSVTSSTPPSGSSRAGTRFPPTMERLLMAWAGETPGVRYRIRLLKGAPKAPSYQDSSVEGVEKNSQRTHAHTYTGRNAEIFSYKISGELTHRDSTMSSGSSATSRDQYYRIKHGEFAGNNQDGFRKDEERSTSQALEICRFESSSNKEGKCSSHYRAFKTITRSALSAAVASLGKTLSGGFARQKVATTHATFYEWSSPSGHRVWLYFLNGISRNGTIAVLIEATLASTKPFSSGEDEDGSPKKKRAANKAKTAAGKPSEAVSSDESTFLDPDFDDNPYKGDHEADSESNNDDDGIESSHHMA